MTEDELPRPVPALGAAEAVEAPVEHAPHVYLYVPDLSTETGWAAHLVPPADDPPPAGRVGFTARNIGAGIAKMHRDSR
jgi:hypothetical protein